VRDGEALTEEQWARWWKQRGGRELRQILFWRWDPIGVSDSFPLAVDEYDGYAGGIADRLRKGSGAGAVAKYLGELEDQHFGERSSSEAHLREVGELAASWFPTSVALWRDGDS
jgi:hypothetical protein